MGDEDAEGKRRNTVYNERMAQAGDTLHTLGMAILIGGVLRFFLDPTAPATEFGRLALTTLAGLALESASLYMKRYRKPED